MLRTTVAPTILAAGEKVSVLPARADAYINYRLLPGESREQITERTRNAIGDRSVLVEHSGLAWEGSRVSSTRSDAYMHIQRTIREVFPGVLVTPGLMVGGTDSHHFRDIAENIYLFTPVRVGPGDLPRFHGTNERISIENYGEMIRFYRRLLSGPYPGAAR